MSSKILVADDSATIRKVIKLIFENDYDFELIEADNGIDAVSKTKELKPNIVLCDVDMLDKDGYEVSKEIKSDSELKKIPVILMVSQYKNVDEAHFSYSKANDRITKPFGGEELIKKVKELLAAKEEAYIETLVKKAEQTEVHEITLEEAPFAMTEPAQDSAEAQTEEISFSAIEPLPAEPEEKIIDGNDWSVATVAEINKVEEKEPEFIAEAEILEAEELADGEEIMEAEVIYEAEEVSPAEEASAIEEASPIEEIPAAEEAPAEVETISMEEAPAVEEPLPAFEEAPAIEEITATPEEQSPTEESAILGGGELEPAEEIELEAPEKEEKWDISEFEETATALPTEAAEPKEEEEKWDIADFGEKEEKKAEESWEQAAPQAVAEETAPYIVPEPAEKTAPTTELKIDAGMISDIVQSKLQSILTDAFLKKAAAETVRDIIENVVWEVVPELAERMIKEEIEKLKSN